MRYPIGRLVAVVLSVMMLVGTAGLVAADDKDAIRKQALKLNDTVGEQAVGRELEALQKDPAKAKELLAVGRELVRAEPSPLNYTAAYILGSAARELKDVDSSQVFFRHCAEKAELIKSNRRVALAYLELIRLHLEDKKPDQAEETCRQFVKLIVDEEEMDDIVLDDDVALLKLLSAISKHEDSAKKLVQAGIATVKERKQRVNFAGVYLLAALARELKDDEAAAVLLRTCLDAIEKVRSEAKLAVLYIEYIDVLFDSKKYADAEKACKEVLELPVGGAVAVAKLHALMRGVQATALQGKIEEAFKQLEPYRKQFPNEPEILKIHGWLLLQADKHEEAVKTYEQLLAKADTDELKERYRYLLSGLYSEIGETDKAMRHLRILLQKNPDHATYNNDLGYMLADHDQDLDEAERLIRKALEKEPKRASYLDSMGWVLFKKKRYKEAKEYLQQAVQDREGQHAEIYDHLGDVHQALGEKAEAVSAWKKAVDVSGSTQKEVKRKADIEKKIKDHQ